MDPLFCSTFGWVRSLAAPVGRTDDKGDIEAGTGEQLAAPLLSPDRHGQRVRFETDTHTPGSDGDLTRSAVVAQCCDMGAVT